RSTRASSPTTSLSPTSRTRTSRPSTRTTRREGSSATRPSVRGGSLSRSPPPLGGLPLRRRDARRLPDLLRGWRRSLSDRGRQRGDRDAGIPRARPARAPSRPTGLPAVLALRLEPDPARLARLLVPQRCVRPLGRRPGRTGDGVGRVRRRRLVARAVDPRRD